MPLVQQGPEAPCHQHTPAVPCAGAREEQGPPSAPGARDTVVMGTAWLGFCPGLLEYITAALLETSKSNKQNKPKHIKKTLSYFPLSFLEELYSKMAEEVGMVMLSVILVPEPSPPHPLPPQSAWTAQLLFFLNILIIISFSYYLNCHF